MTNKIALACLHQQLIHLNVTRIYCFLFKFNFRIKYHSTFPKKLHNVLTELLTRQQKKVLHIFFKNYRYRNTLIMSHFSINHILLYSINFTAYALLQDMSKKRQLVAGQVYMINSSYKRRLAITQLFNIGISLLLVINNEGAGVVASLILYQYSLLMIE